MIKLAYDNGFWLKDAQQSCHGVMNGKNQCASAISPNTKRPLLRYCRLSELLWPHKLQMPINFYFEWGSNISNSPFYYKHLPNDEIKILEYGQGGVDTNFPYAGYPEYFPARSVVLDAIPAADQLFIQQLNRGELDRFDAERMRPELCLPTHQVGGEPLGIGEVPCLECIECGKEMFFLATFGDDCGDERGYTGNEYVVVVYLICKNCSVMAAIQLCD